MVLKPEHLSVELTRFRELRQWHQEMATIADATFIEGLDARDHLPAAIAGAVRFALEDEAQANWLRERLDEMEARLRRIEADGEGRRDAGLRAMGTASGWYSQRLLLPEPYARPVLRATDEFDARALEGLPQINKGLSATGRNVIMRFKAQNSVARHSASLGRFGRGPVE